MYDSRPPKPVRARVPFPPLPVRTPRASRRRPRNPKYCCEQTECLYTECLYIPLLLPNPQKGLHTLSLNTGLQGRVSIPPSIMGHERGHLSPHITRLKPERQTRLQYTQADGGRTQTHSGTTTDHYNLCSHMDHSSPKLPPPPIPRSMRHMARSLRAHTCSPSLPPPLPSLPCRRLLPTATMVNVEDEKEDLDFGPYSSDDGDNIPRSANNDTAPADTAATSPIPAAPTT